MTSPMAKQAYDQMVGIAAALGNSGYLAHYRDDLFKHDKAQLLDSVPHADRWIWILRSFGTALFPIAAGHDQIWATYWLDQGNDRAAPSLAYMIDLQAGTVEPISYARVRYLASIPHPTGHKVKISIAA